MPRYRGLIMLPRCSDCGMIGRKEQIKRQVAETTLSQKLVVFPICIHCILKDNHCVNYGEKHYLSEEEMACKVYSLYALEPEITVIKSGLDLSEAALLYCQTKEKYPDLPVRIVMV